MQDESPHLNSGGPEMAGAESGQILSSEGQGERPEMPDGYENVNRRELLHLVRDAAKPGIPFPIPPQFGHWAVAECAWQIASPSVSKRDKRGAIKTLAVLERVNQEAAKIAKGENELPAAPPPAVAPQIIQVQVEAYLNGNPGSNGNGHPAGSAATYARLVGGSLHRGKQESVPPAVPHSGPRSDDHGTPERSNGNGHARS